MGAVTTRRCSSSAPGHARQGQSGTKSCFSSPSICAGASRNPAICSADQCCNGGASELRWGQARHTPVPPPFRSCNFASPSPITSGGASWVGTGASANCTGHDLHEYKFGIPIMYIHSLCISPFCTHASPPSLLPHPPLFAWLCSFLRMLVYLVIYYSGQVSLAHHLLSWHN